MHSLRSGIESDSSATPSIFPASIAIAYSGGLDSSALLHLAHDYAKRHGMKLFAFHVHHGISPHADHWLIHCRQEAERLDAIFDSAHIRLSESNKTGIEEAARLQRYAALGELCRRHRVSLLLTAHHQDDQAETVLLQMLRGSGIAGLSGMDTANTATLLLGSADLIIARPLLSVSRSELEEFVKNTAIRHIEDESNQDPRYARNALRQKVMPELEHYFPGFQERFCRTARHVQSAQRLLVELAAQDLKECASQCANEDAIDIAALRILSDERIHNVLRYWFASRAMRMPSTAWLHELCEQIFESKPDAQLCMTHADCHVRRHRNHIFITPRQPDGVPDIPPVSFRWQGEKEIHFPNYSGTLLFSQSEEGIDAGSLGEQKLSIRLRQGGERLKLAANRPTKALKYHYQAFDIPAWERERLPIIWAGEKMLYVAGVGMDCHQFGSPSSSNIKLHWKFDRKASPPFGSNE